MMPREKVAAAPALAIAVGKDGVGLRPIAELPWQAWCLPDCCIPVSSDLNGDPLSCGPHRGRQWRTWVGSYRPVPRQGWRELTQSLRQMLKARLWGNFSYYLSHS